MDSVAPRQPTHHHSDLRATLSVYLSLKFVSLTYQHALKLSDQTVRMCMLIWSYSISSGRMMVRITTMKALTNRLPGEENKKIVHTC